MTYKVITPFADLQNKTKDFPDGRIYAVGDSFPCTRSKVSVERIVELLSTRNAMSRAVIKEVGDK